MHLVDGKHSFADLVDVERLRGMLECFSRATGFTTAIVSHPNLELLIATGWRDICTKFHRTASASEAVCKQSNVELTAHLNEHGTLSIRRCGNGMVDGATPIIIKGAHVANLCTGQVLFEDPDIEWFRKQAEEYGYDIEAYLEALRRVPVVSREEFEGTLSYLSEMAVMLAERGLVNLQSREAAQSARESEQRYRGVVEDTPVLICRYLPDGEITFVNQAYCEYAAKPAEALVRSSFFEVIPEPYRDSVVASIGALTAESPTQSYEHRVIGADGEIRWQRWTNRALFDVQGRAYAYQSIGEDVTERKRAEEDLANQQSLMRDIIDGTDDAVFVKDLQGRYLTVNSADSRTMNRTVAEIIGRTDAELFPKEVSEFIRRMDRQTVETGAYLSYEQVYPGADGEPRTYLIGKFPKRAAGGAIDGVIGIARDITERKRAEEALRESESRLQALSEASFEAIFISEAGVCMDQNQAAERMFGHAREEAIGRVALEWIAPESRERVRHNMAAGRERPYEVTALRRDGTTFPVEIQARMINYKDRRVRVTALRDITERKRTEEGLRRSEAHLRALINTLPDLVWLKDPAGVYLSCNPRFERFFGASEAEIVGKTDYDFLNEELVEFFRGKDKAAVEAGRPCMNEEEVTYADDGHKEILETIKTPMCDSEGMLIGVLGIGRDITERKRVEEEMARHRDHLEELVDERSQQLEESRTQLHRAQRLASVGTLAAGIAHEINNPLGLILMSAQRALEKSGDREAMEAMLHRIKGNVKRCARIVKSVLQFSREQSSDKWQVDVNHCVRRSEEFTREYASFHGVRVRFERAGELPTVFANPTELEQTFVNLLYNAIEASEPGQTVSLRTERIPAGVRVTVTDQGRGMAAEEREHAFDPFYTTRQRHGGTGLGLSIVHGIIADQGGTVEVESQPGEGAKIVIVLPVDARGNAKE